VYWYVSFFISNQKFIFLILINTGDNMLTALSVARDCDMIPDDAKIIAVEATEPNSTPTFTYAQVFNRRVKEVRYDLNVC
jgi:magnesium-transporting ATPase (P-type)